MCNELLSIGEFCELAGISRTKFRRMRGDGEIPAVRRFGRRPKIYRSEAENWLRNLPEVTEVKARA